MVTLKAMAVDMAFANMGIAHVDITISGTVVRTWAKHVKLVTTKGDDKKLVRKSSSDLRRALELVGELRASVADYDPSICFAEVPSGSLSANAARALGIAVGCLASVAIPIIEVSPLEVKRAVGLGNKAVSKAQIIDWAVQQWPDLPWIRNRGKLSPTNEHMADALAAAVAGTRTEEFKRMIAMHHEIPHPDNKRPSSNRVRIH